MGKNFDDIKKGLQDAIAFERGDKKRARIAYPPEIDVRGLRRRLKMTQRDFSIHFMIPISTLRNWEQGLREPEGPARAYLNVIARKPSMVREVLEQV